MEEKELSLEKQFELQKMATRLVDPPNYDARRENLSNLLKIITQNVELLCKAVNDDFGNRSCYETRIYEIFPIIQSIRYTLKHLKSWMLPQKRKVAFWFKPAKAYVMPQSLGVVGIVVPWNLPIHLSIMPLISALAAGNCVMIKMSSLTPHTNALIKRILGKIFPTQDVTVISGSGDISSRFVNLPFDHLFFTGSSEHGKEVMKAASENLTAVTLELGGKSPAIIGHDFPMKLAVERILNGKLFNAGQTCIGPDYVFVPRGKEDLFVKFAIEYVRNHYPDVVYNQAYTSIINERYFDRLVDLCADAKQKGAMIINLAEDGGSEAIRKFAPCLLFNTKSNMRIINEEIFGPILPVLSYEDITEAVGFVEAHPKPLALYYFSKDKQNVGDVLYRTVSGGVTINDTLLHAAQVNMPFGGVGESGIGQYHGKAGFDTFSHHKSVFLQSRINLFQYLKPPFGKLANTILRFMVRS